MTDEEKVKYIQDNFHIDEYGVVTRNDRYKGYYPSANSLTTMFEIRVNNEKIRLAANKICYALATGKWPHNYIRGTKSKNGEIIIVNNDIEKYIYRLLTSGRSKERIVKSRFISSEKLKYLIKQTHCAQTNLLFRLDSWIYKPSVDRINSDLTYIDDNTQMVCEMYNLMKQNATDEDAKMFIKLAYGSMTKDA